MAINFLLKLPLFLAYLLGTGLTCILALKRRNISNALAFLGFTLLAAVQAVGVFTAPFTARLYGRGMTLTRAAFVSTFATLILNLISAVAVICIVGAIALATRDKRQF
ncbi:MAG: hypothetical protein ACUVR2_05825 [Anaerolineae bacterium]